MILHSYGHVLLLMLLLLRTHTQGVIGSVVVVVNNKKIAKSLHVGTLATTMNL